LDGFIRAAGFWGILRLPRYDPKKVPWLYGDDWARGHDGPRGRRSLPLALRRCRITSNFLVNKLHAEGYLPPLAEQVTQTFQVLVDQLPIDLQLLASFREATLAAPLDGYFDDRFLASAPIESEEMIFSLTNILER
jgi:hypothetical protein